MVNQRDNIGKRQAALKTALERKLGMKVSGIPQGVSTPGRESAHRQRNIRATQAEIFKNIVGNQKDIEKGMPRENLSAWQKKHKDIRVATAKKNRNIREAIEREEKKKRGM